MKLQLPNFLQKRNSLRFLLITVFIAIISCNENLSQTCSNTKFKTISFVCDSISLEIPADWNIVDSVKVPSKSLIFTRTIKKTDTSYYSSFLWIRGLDRSIYLETDNDSLLFFEYMKAKVKSFGLGKDSLISEAIEIKNGLEVQFIKAVVNDPAQNIYLGHIGFILPGKREVEILIRTNENNRKISELLVDCIFNSLQIR